jgi:small subunit ribosomal protein S20
MLLVSTETDTIRIRWVAPGNGSTRNVAYRPGLTEWASLLEPAMPNTPSAIKRLKQNVKRRMHNRITKKIIKTYTKRTLAAVAENELEKAQADFRTTVAKIDKAGARRVLHPNTAARRKSKLTRDFNAALAKVQG